MNLNYKIQYPRIVDSEAVSHTTAQAMVIMMLSHQNRFHKKNGVLIGANISMELKDTTNQEPLTLTRVLTLAANDEVSLVFGPEDVANARILAGSQAELVRIA